MIAVDTNIVVLLLMDDEFPQEAAARAIFSNAEVCIAKTVIVKTACVLRSVYGFDANKVSKSIRLLLGLKNVHVEDRGTIHAALALVEAGVEFSDAVHVFSRQPGSNFQSFDTKVVQRA